jgi:hypothetical protein
MIDKKLNEIINHDPLTRGHKTCRYQWAFERFVPPQAFSTVDSDAAPQSGTFHTASRYLQALQTVKQRQQTNVKGKLFIINKLR